MIDEGDEVKRSVRRQNFCKSTKHTRFHHDHHHIIQQFSSLSLLPVSSYYGN